MDKIFYVIAFESTHVAIKTEKELMDKIKIEMIPTPREISASCGISLKFSTEDLNEMLEIIQGLSYDLDVYKIDRTGDQKVAEKIR
ncbi:MAG: DUF3343 domain-containing protein [Firmicutes bacterium]|jgi:hypothetical protein|nr:DUF3343 domain-containing protein [Bacillota bacterium]